MTIEVTMLSNINFSPEFKEKRERWRDGRGRMKVIKPEIKKALELSIERGNKLLVQATNICGTS